jgi:hypothetical protein
MEADISTIKKDIYKIISKAYNWLFNLAIHTGNWEEVRSTALVGLCLELREPMNSPWLEHIKKWLLEQQKPIGNDMASWGEELWDTSMALLSLNKLGLTQRDPKYQKAVKWIISIYNKNNRNNWHNEPWETSWCLLVLLETIQTPEISKIIYNSLKWLMGLQDSEGKIVSPHYTAYFLLVAYQFLKCNLELSQEEKDTISTALTNAKKFLISNISKDSLWTGESWSNGQILWALSITENFPCNNIQLLQNVLEWFSTHQDKEDGNWEDVEDTASAILGLYYLLRQLEALQGVEEPELRKELNIYFKTPTLCLKRKFIQNHEDGYTSINLSPTFKKVVIILFAIASALTAIISLWDFIVGLFWR